MSARRQIVVSVLAAFAVLVWAGGVAAEGAAAGDGGRVALAVGGGLAFVGLTALRVRALLRRGDP